MHSYVYVHGCIGVLLCVFGTTHEFANSYQNYEKYIADPLCELAKPSPLAICAQACHSKLKTLLLFYKSYPNSVSFPLSNRFNILSIIHHSRLTVHVS